jgi:hypothetical protein
MKEAQERDFWGLNKTNPKNENEEQKNLKAIKTQCL